ncbi:MAG: chemotaxis protein CheB, partial [Desulfovibrionaceae bacterium]
MVTEHTKSVDSGEELAGKDGKSFFIVGIGASAGGLEALEAFFDNMPSTEGFAFVIVQHLSPDYKSLMPELLSRHTRMQVFPVEDGVDVAPGCIYLIPPKKNLSMFHGRLFLTEQEPTLNLPIDIFLRSLAEDQGERAVGVILSGTGSDGTRGVRAIKEAGGMVMVQDEESAQFDGMPRSAAATGICDYILAPASMPEALEKFADGHLHLSRTLQAKPLASSVNMNKILALLNAKFGVDFSFYKENTIVRRIERRMGINQIESAEQYIRFLEGAPRELNTLYKEILIGVTKFFREPEAFRVIKEKVLPDIFRNKKRHEPIRVWAAGCSTGEEAYTHAIQLTEYCEAHDLRNEIKVFATDIDRDALEFASYGIYPESIAVDASLERLNRYFNKKGDSYQIKPYIREKVVFAHHNIIKDPPFAKIDLVSCRNLLIYLQAPLQKKVLSSFYFSLNERGFLFLGNSETVGEHSNYFESFDVKWKIYRYKGGMKPVNVHFSKGLERPPQRPAPPRAGYQECQRYSRDMDSVYEQIVEQYLPPSVLVDEDKTMLHVFGEVDDYLRLPRGKMHLDVLKMARDGVAIPLSTALQRAFKKKEEVTYRDIAIKRQDKAYKIKLLVRPVQGGNGQHFCLVSFQRSEGDGERDAGEFFDMEESVKSRIDDLEKELQYTKENLQATIEELETSNEELQATNEELLAANEELQSTNEELQSVNEELITVNSEYQKKIQELTELNDDMNNLLATTDIGTIFLDKNLTIRKYTPPAARQVNIIKTDIGRPISDLSHNLQRDEFVGDIREVIDSLQGKEVEVQNNDGVWFLVKIKPYRASSEKVDGAVVSLVDITSRKAVEDALQREHDLLMRVMQNSPSATTMVDKNGRIFFANQKAEQVLGLTRDDLGQLGFDAERFKITDMEGRPIPRDQLPFAIIKRTGEAVLDCMHKIASPEGG